MLALSLAVDCDKIDLFDLEELLWSDGYAPLRRRGDTETWVPPDFVPAGQH